MLTASAIYSSQSLGARRKGGGEKGRSPIRANLAAVSKFKCNAINGPDYAAFDIAHLLAICKPTGICQVATTSTHFTAFSSVAFGSGNRLDSCRNVHGR